MEQKDVIIIGGGPAGMAAAVRLYEKGIHNILILEREKQLGGILRQCIHDGFGVTRFGEALSGPEYASRFQGLVEKYGIPCILDATVIGLTKNKQVTAVTTEGIRQWQAGCVILAMGCRERTRGALQIPGDRPAGVYTAGVAQAYVNLYNRMPGREIVILGSGDIGMIMARRLTLEGAHVQAVFEAMPVPGGLSRNREQCLNDFGIPLYLSHTVTRIFGKGRLSGVEVSQVDEKMHPIEGTQKRWDCDTLILSVGLIPENELSTEAGVELDPVTGGAVVDENYQTSVPGIFSAGNVLHVHDLVDFVSMEAEKMADAAAGYVRHEKQKSCFVPVKGDRTIHHIVPHKISGTAPVNFSLRVKEKTGPCTIEFCQSGKVIAAFPKKKALPAEMMHVTLKPECMMTEGELEVRVCEKK